MLLVVFESSFMLLDQRLGERRRKSRRPSAARAWTGRPAASCTWDVTLVSRCRWMSLPVDRRLERFPGEPRGRGRGLVV